MIGVLKRAAHHRDPDALVSNQWGLEAVLGDGTSFAIEVAGEGYI